ncbi:MAG: hypothetical protein QG599_3329 [Pseudomonadota bacterium]|nr:hypothetical protein [Pseudomonadota bacterium]
MPCVISNLFRKPIRRRDMLTGMPMPGPIAKPVSVAILDNATRSRALTSAAPAWLNFGKIAICVLESKIRTSVSAAKWAHNGLSGDKKSRLWRRIGLGCFRFA